LRYGEPAAPELAIERGPEPALYVEMKIAL
jgi:hypothetical protein